MFDKFFVGLDLTGAEDNRKQLPVSRVTLLLDDENAVTAGDDTGMELVADCLHATQAMVDAILAQVKGHRYQMYSAENANIDPAAELGDGVTVDGMYSVISRIDDDGSGYAGLSAPGEAELEDEYPSGGPMTREFNRKISETRSRITKTAEQIRLEVQNEVRGLSSSIDIKLGSITSRVEDAENGLSQTLRVAADGVTITNASGDTLTIDGGQIDASRINTAQLDASRINANDLQLTGVITWRDLSQSVQDSINTTYDTAGSALDTANSLANGTGGGTFINGTTVNSPSVVGGTITGSTIYFGSWGGDGILRNTTGFDGENTTQLVELAATRGLLLSCTEGFRIEANKLWINLDISRVNFKKNGVWTSLAALLGSAGA